MADTVEKRVGDLESLVWDIPNLLNARFQRFETALTDNTARLVSLERIAAALQTDMRDLRGGVTRQLVGQDQRLTAIESRLGAMESRLGAMEDQRLAAIESRLGAMESSLGAMEDQRLAAIESRLGAIEGAMAEILRRLPGNGS